MQYICVYACVKPFWKNNTKNKKPNSEIQAIVRTEMSFTSTNQKIHRTKWLQSCAGHSLTVLESASRKSCHSSLQIPNGSSLHRLAWSTSMFGNKCRITLRCLRGRIHPSFSTSWWKLRTASKACLRCLHVSTVQNVWGWPTHKTWWCNAYEATHPESWQSLASLELVVPLQFLTRTQRWQSFLKCKLGCIVRFHHCIGYLWRWDHREGCHDAVGIFLTDFGDQERTSFNPNRILKHQPPKPPSKTIERLMMHQQLEMMYTSHSSTERTWWFFQMLCVFCVFCTSFKGFKQAGGKMQPRYPCLLQCLRQVNGTIESLASNPWWSDFFPSKIHGHNPNFRQLMWKKNPMKHNDVNHSKLVQDFCPSTGSSHEKALVVWATTFWRSFEGHSFNLLYVDSIPEGHQCLPMLLKTSKNAYISCACRVPKSLFVGEHRKAFA